MTEIDPETTAFVEMPEGPVEDWPMDFLSKLTGHDEETVRDALWKAEVAKTSPPSGYPLDTPEKVIEHARCWEGAANRYEDGCFPTREGTWRVEASYPLGDLEKLMEGGRAGWAAWFAGECAMHVEEERYGYLDLLVEDIVEEVVVVELPDGRVDIWDGWHRIAAAIVKGAPGIPAAVGIPPPEHALRLQGP